MALGQRSYPILIGPNLIAAAGAEIAARFANRSVRIVTDANVAALHLPRLIASLEAAGIRAGDPVIVPAGEPSKSFGTFEHVCERVLASHIDRGSVLVALGGGVVGDLAGFAAAVLLRGLEFVQMPTTLLAQVDSSVGGKTGINSASGKNLAGAFHQPSLVLADTDTLDTLPARAMRSGYAEIAKHGLIVDAPFFDWLDVNSTAVLQRNGPERTYAITRSCQVKAEIVARDEHEHGDRALLNFGHTFGHALESLTGYGDAITHGEAVAIGSVLAFDLSVDLGLCAPELLQRVAAHLRGVGLPTEIPPIDGLTPAAMLEAMRADKKNIGERRRLVLVHGIGNAFTAEVEEKPLRACLERAFQRQGELHPN